MVEGTLTREERVLVARDVLALMDVEGRIEVESGNYYFGWLHSEDDFGDLDDSVREAGEQRPRDYAPCMVCARGALFLASVDRFDKCNLPRGVSLSRVVLDRTGKEWGEQARVIEAAFEVSPHLSIVGAEFGDNFDDPRERLQAICKNIIENNGEFCP